MEFYLLFTPILVGILRDVNADTKSVLELHKLLQDNYSPYIRPVSSAGATLKVNITGRFNRIIKMDDVEQVLTTDLWVENTWYDVFLTWNESEYPRNVILPADNVWKPDLIFYDGQQGDKQSLRQLSSDDVRVWSDGQVIWDVKTVIQTSCQMHLKMFPWDKQRCNISLGPWLYNNKEVELVKAHIITTQELRTSTWEVLSICPYTKLFGIGGHTYSQIIFEVHMARKPLFYLINLLAPCCLLASLAILAYLLPIDSGERVSLPVTLFLSEIVFLTSVTSYIPLTSEVLPRISLMISCLVVCMAFTILSSVITFYVYCKHNKPPTCLHRLSSGLLTTKVDKIYCKPVDMQNNENVEEVQYKKADGNDVKPDGQTEGSGYRKLWQLTGKRLNRFLACANTIGLVIIYLWIVCTHITLSEK